MSLARWTGVERKDQGPAFLTGLGHGGTHWVAGIFYILLPYINREFGLSYAQAGTLVAIFHASAFGANFISGLVVDLSGRRVVFQVISLLMGAVALSAFAISETYLLLCLLTVFIGISNNLWHPPAIAFLSLRYPDNRGYALSVHALCANLGDTLAPIAAGSVIAIAGWQTAAGLGGLPVIGVAVIIALTLLPLDRPTAGSAHNTTGLAEYFTGLKRIVASRAIAGLCLMAGFRSMTQNGLYVFLPLYLVDVLKTGPVLMGAAMMVLQLGGGFAAPVAGTVSDRIGRRPVVLAGLGVTTLVIALLTLIDNDVLFVAGVSLLGFALFAVRPVVHSWMMDMAPKELAGSATSLMFGTQSLFSILMPLIGGVIADTYGLAAVFYMLAFTVLVANSIVYLLPKDGAGESNEV